MPIIIPVDDETDDAPVEEPAPEEEVKQEEEQNTEGEEEQNTVEEDTVKIGQLLVKDDIEVWEKGNEEDTVKVDRLSVKDDIGTGVGEEEPPKKSKESDNRVKVDTENDPTDPTEASID